MADFPAPGYEEAGFWGIVSQFYGIFMVIAILYPVSNVVRSLVMEKEARIREGMRMMSLQDSALYASWAFHFGSTFLIIAGLIVAVGGKLFQYSDKTLIFLYYLLCTYLRFVFGQSIRLSSIQQFHSPDPIIFPYTHPPDSLLLDHRLRLLDERLL